MGKDPNTARGHGRTGVSFRRLQELTNPGAPDSWCQAAPG
ncbi:hypothetical protein VDGL01_09867 [Verticillium dahliae]